MAGTKIPAVNSENLDFRIKSICADMSDDDRLERLKEVKNERDIREERVAYFEMRAEFLEKSLMNAIAKSKVPGTTLGYGVVGPITQDGEKNKADGAGSSLKKCLVTIRDMIKTFFRGDSDGSAKRELVESLNTAIDWASKSDPEEEDEVMSKLLNDSLSNALGWVMNMDITEDEKPMKQQLIGSLWYAIDLVKERSSDSEEDVVRDLFTDYVMVAGNWKRRTKEKDKTGREGDPGGKAVQDSHGMDEEGDEEMSNESEEERRRKARQELIYSLQAIFDWVKTIKTGREEQYLQHELMLVLTIATQWAQDTAESSEDVIMKQLLQEVFMVSLNWVVSVDVEDGEEVKQHLINSLIFAINWARTYDAKSDDEVTRELLRTSLTTAINWKRIIDRPKYETV